MKKALSLLLTLVLCLSLCACKKSDAAEMVDSLILEIGSVTIESGAAIIKAEEAYAKLSEKEKKSIENFPVLTAARLAFNELHTMDGFLRSASNLPSLENLYIEIQNNPALANQTYGGNIYVYDGYVVKIGMNYVDLGIPPQSDMILRVHLSQDELVKLKQYEKWTVVGILNICKTDAGSISVKMTEAYLVSDIVEVTGMVKVVSKVSNPVIANLYGDISIVFDDSAIINFDVGDTITVVGKMYYSPPEGNGAFERSYHLYQMVDATVKE